MAQTYDSTHDDRLLLAYLLRLLSDEQAEQVELATLTDDEVADRLKVVEHDLVDGYIRDTLDPPTRDRFESYYLSSPIRRERVRFAAEFLRAIDAIARETAPGAQAVVVRTGRTPRGWRLAAVAAVLVLTCGTLLLLRDGVRDTQPGAGAPAVEAGRSAPPSGGPSTVAATGGAVADSEAIALVLLPQTRALSEPPALGLRPGTSRVRVELRLESNDYPRYQAGLRDPRTNAIVWRSGWVAPTIAGGRSVVEVAVPAALLKAQHYSLDLTGRANAGAAHVVGSYAFTVTPP